MVEPRMASPQMIYFCVSWATVLLKSPYSPDISAAGAHFIMSGTSHITAAGETSQRDKQGRTGCAGFGAGLNLEKSGFAI